MSKSYRTCSECGARITEGAAQCNLCGSSVAAQDTAEERAVAVEPEPEAPLPADAVPADSVPVAEGPPSVPIAAPPAATEGVYCNQCGWKNPPGARFCSTCGAALQVLDAPLPAAIAPSVVTAAIPPVDSAPAEADSEARKMPPATPAASPADVVTERKAVSRQVGIIIGAGLLLVVALFLVTAVSKTRPDPAPVQPAEQAPPAAGAEVPPLSGQLATQVATLEDEIAQLSGPARVARQRDLVALFFSAGRLDRAALQQQAIAQATGETDDWKRAGDLFYDWMNTIEDGARKAQAAGQAIQAYQTVLEVDPDNHDVRTDMATAYLNTGSPMLGVTEIKRVLEADPDHLHARFNYGIMLTWIQRPDQAVEQFERVKALVDESSTYYQRADEAIRVIREGGNL